MTMLASQITSLTVVYSIVYSGVNQRKHQSSASLAFVLEIHRGPVNFPHKWPVTRKMFPFDDVIMNDGQVENMNEVHPCPVNRLTVWLLGNFDAFLRSNFQADFGDWWLRCLLGNCSQISWTSLMIRQHWCRYCLGYVKVIRHYLGQYWYSVMPSYDVTRSQWVKRKPLYSKSGKNGTWGQNGTPDVLKKACLV